MKNIILKYKGKSIKRSLPENWNELTGKQLIKISGLFNKQLRIYEFRLICLFYIISVNYRIFDRIDRETLYLIGEQINFLLKENNLVRNLIPSIKIRLKKYYGPSDRFQNITLIEFAKAETRYKNYIETNNEKYLNELIAILYRPKKWFIPFLKLINNYNGDKRREYNDRYIKNMDRISNLPINLRLAILLYWEGCRLYIMNKYTHVFSRDQEEKKNDTGWAGLITDLAGTKFGDIDQTANTLLHTILIYLETAAIRAIEMEKDIKNKGK